MVAFDEAHKAAHAQRAPNGNPEAIWKLVMAMKLNGLPKEAINQGFMADFEARQFDEYWSRSYAELCKGSMLHD